MASVVWHHSLLLMNSFNKTEAAVLGVSGVASFIATDEQLQ